MNYRIWPLIPFVLPTIVQGHIILLFVLMFRIGKVERYIDATPFVRKRKDSSWSQALAGCVLLSPYADDNTITHESIHILQYWDANFLAAILGGIVSIFDWRIGLTLWATSGVLWMVPQYVTAWLRGDPAYRGALFEEHAYVMELLARRQWD